MFGQVRQNALPILLYGNSLSLADDANMLLSVLFVVLARSKLIAFSTHVLQAVFRRLPLVELGEIMFLLAGCALLRHMSLVANLLIGRKYRCRSDDSKFWRLACAPAHSPYWCGIQESNLTGPKATVLQTAWYTSTSYTA